MSFRAHFLEIISNIFDFKRNKTGSSIILFVAGFASFTWFLTSFGNLVMLAGDWCLNSFFHSPLVKDWPSAWQKAWADMSGPFLCFAIAFGFMCANYTKNTAPPKPLALVPPKPHRGLILQLSIYYKKSSPYETVKEVGQHVHEIGVGARDNLLKSNWGPLVVACEHHCTMLEHCWLVCTKDGSADQYDVAQEVVKKFAGHNVKCHKREIPDANDISMIVPVIDRIYRDARQNHDLPPSEIIADFTGGTAAMTGAMILATIEDERHVEYLRQDQDRQLVVKENAGMPSERERALTPQEIARKEILITITTSPDHVKRPDDMSK